ncbi:hypothetical protein D3C80_1755850 [compost metagenome]
MRQSAGVFVGYDEVVVTQFCNRCNSARTIKCIADITKACGVLDYINIAAQIQARQLVVVVKCKYADGIIFYHGKQFSWLI